MATCVSFKSDLPLSTCCRCCCPCCCCFRSCLRNICCCSSCGHIHTTISAGRSNSSSTSSDNNSRCRRQCRSYPASLCCSSCWRTCPGHAEPAAAPADLQHILIRAPAGPGPLEGLRADPAPLCRAVRVSILNQVPAPVIPCEQNVVASIAAAQPQQPLEHALCAAHLRVVNQHEEDGLPTAQLLAQVAGTQAPLLHRQAGSLQLCQGPLHTRSIFF